jgi:hypothetical protein
VALVLTEEANTARLSNIRPSVSWSWGSTILLIRLRFWYLASVRAVVTLLALTSDAFVQQSVSYPLWNVQQPHLLASVPYTQKYSHSLDGAGPFKSAAVYDGVFTSNLTRSSSSLQTTCSSGNCTFPPYASLGVCSRCADVTSLIKHTFHQEESKSEDYDTWTLPNGLELVGYESQTICESQSL